MWGIKRLIGAALALGGAVVMLGLGISLLIPPETVRERALGHLGALIGLDVVARGRTHLNLFPRLRFELDDVSFSVPGRPDAPPVATTDKLVGELDPWRLLVGEAVPDVLTLVRPRVTLPAVDDPEGWPLGAGGAIEQAMQEPEGEEPTVRIGRIGIEDGRIIYSGGEGREQVSALTGTLDWPRLSRAAEASFAGVWRGEIFDVRTTVSEPKKLLRYGRTGLLLELSGAGSSLRFRGQALLTSGPQLNGKLSARTASLRNIANLVGLRLPGERGLNETSVSGDLRFAGAVASLSDAELTLDGNRAEGTLELQMGQPVPMLRGTLATETLDLTPYRSVADAPRGGGGAFLDFALDAEKLARFGADVRFSAARVLFGEMSLGGTAGTVTARAGVLDIGIAETEIYEGTGAGTFSITADPAGPAHWKAVAALDGVQVQPLFNGLLGLDALSGTGTLRLNAGGRGHGLSEVVASLGGGARVEVANGVVRGLRTSVVAQALASGRLEDLGAAANGSSEFSRLSADIAFADGVGQLTALHADAGPVVVDGEGRLKLPDGGIDARAVVRLTEASADPSAIQELPVVVRGNVSAPRVFPPTRWLLQRVAPAAVEADPIDLRGGDEFWRGVPRVPAPLR